MLAAYCLLVAEMEEDPANFRRHSQLRQFAACFGLDPTSRSRIYIVGGSADATPTNYLDA